jgi:hypothetical protein
MSRKRVSSTVSVLAKSVFALGFVMGALQSCGSSSSSDATALCQQSCDKELACTPDAGSIGATADMSCKSSCAAQTATASKCSNLAAIESAVKACLAMDCASFESCIETTVPDCATSSGNGGANGTGTGGSNGGGAGTSGAGGGSSGTGSCSSCTKGQACCVGALQLVGQDAGACSFSATTCNSLSGASQTSYIGACAEEITAGGLLGVAGCQ